VNPLPTLSKAFDVEMIRDGGSFAATFGDEGGRRYILFTQIKIIDRDYLTRERIGYELPVLIDCDPDKRPPDTDRVHYGELSGPKSPITWAQARTLMVLTQRLAKGADQWRREWLECMNYVVVNDGGIPPTMETIIHVRRQPG
jgi:hypothetical protein